MFHNLFDSHVHSGNSPDGAQSVMCIAEQAQRIGLMGIAITDHAECRRFREDGYHIRIVQSAVDTAKASAAFRHQMTFSMGIELGFTNGDDFSMADYITGFYPYDFILGSCHYPVEEFPQIDFADMSEEKRKKLMDRYFDDLLAFVGWGGFDSLAHITYPLRHATPDNGVQLSLDSHMEQIDAVLRCLAEKGKALEINTFDICGPLKDILPMVRILSRFKELGGEAVTIGSGAHYKEAVGMGIQDGMELLREAGFSRFAFYHMRKPVMLNIV